jgi:hypothetical protein
MNTLRAPLKKALWAGAILAGARSFAHADTIADYQLNFVDGLDINLSVIVDQTTGQALSGTGTIVSITPGAGYSLLQGDTLTLIPAVQGVAHYRTGDGTDLNGDAIFKTSAPYLNTFAAGGLVFQISGSGQNGLNLGTDSTASNTNYTAFVSGQSQTNSGNNNYTSTDGTLTVLSVTTVPLPATAWLMISGLGGLGAMAVRKRRPA